MKKLNILFLCAICAFAMGSLNAQKVTLPKIKAESPFTTAKPRPADDFATLKAVPQSNSALPEGAVVLWGGPGDPNGEFDGGLNDWTSEGMDANGDNAMWSWEADADVSEGAYSPDEPINSPSAGNGAVTFNSDFYDNGGVPGDFGLGIHPAPASSDLISPIIDMSDHDNIALNFYSYYRRFDSDPAVSWSNDGGASWSDPVIVHTTNESPTNVGAVNREVLIYMPGAGGTDQFRVRFQFLSGTQGYYFWMIDDVAIVEQPRNDLKIGAFFYTPAAYSQPESQIKNDTFSFFTNVTNAGSVAQTNVVLGAQVRDADLAIIYETEVMIPEIAVGVTDSSFDIAGTFIPDMLGQDAYFLTYTIESDSVDQWDVDNIDGDPFVVSQFTYATEDNDNAFESYFTPGGSPPWQIANVYNTAESFGGDEYVAESITFAGTTNADDPLAGKQVNVWLLEVSDDIDGGFGNLEELKFDGNPGLTIKAFGFHTYTNEAGEDRVTVSLEGFNGEEDLVLNPSKRYLALVDYSTSNTIFHAFNTKINYEAGNRLNFLAFNESDGNWFGGFTDGENLLALVRLQINLKPDNTVEELPASSLTVSPNPTSNMVNLNIDLEVESRAVIHVTDISGALLQTLEYDRLGQDNIELDMSDYANGTYLVRLATEEGARTVKVSVQK